MRFISLVFVCFLLAVQGAYAEVVIERVIDVQRYQTVSHGNMLGLAYDASRQELTFPNGFDGESKVVTITLDGNLVREWSLNRLIGNGFISGGLTGLSYDPEKDGLFAWRFRSSDGNHYRNDLLHTSLDGTEVFGEFAVSGDLGGDGLLVEGDSIWTTKFNTDTIHKYSRNGDLLSTTPVEGFPDGFPGPLGIARAFDEGFFLVDHFGERIVHVNEAGQLLGAISTASFGDGRGMAIATDLAEQRTFLLINNAQIYVLRGVPEPSISAFFCMGLLAIARSIHRRRTHA